MLWYYALNNERKGPVEEAELDQLFRQGVLNETTWVWREGMPEWRSYGEARAAQRSPAQVAAPPAPPVAGGVVCAECGRAFAPDQVIRIGGRFICAGCKPIVVQKLREGATTDTESEQIRKEHIKHEASVKSIGILYFLGAALLGLISVMFIFVPANSTQDRAMSIGVAVGFLAVAGLQLWAGIGLRQLRPWARIVSGVLSAIGLLGFPIGTLINGYILYLLFSKKGTMVFSDGYKHVIEQTPQIKYKTSIIVWIFLGLLVVLLAIGMISLIFVRLGKQ